MESVSSHVVHRLLVGGPNACDGRIHRGGIDPATTTLITPGSAITTPVCCMTTLATTHFFSSDANP